MKSFLTIALVIAIVGAIILSGCAQPAPSPTPSPVPTAPPKQVDMQVLGSTTGGTCFNISAAFADIVSKNSKWVRLSVRESPGGLPDMAEMSKMTPQIKSLSLGCLSGESFWMGRKGLPPIKEPLAQEKLVMASIDGYTSFMTLDPKIKSMQDFVGKRVGIPPAGHVMEVMSTATLKEAGVWDKLGSVARMGWGDLTKNLRDKMLDVVCCTGLRAEKGFDEDSNLKEIKLTQKVYFVDWDKQAFQKAVAKVMGFPVVHTTIQPNTPPFDNAEPFGVHIMYLGWHCYPDVPDDVVYEIVKQTVENIGQFKNYAPSWGAAIKAENSASFAIEKETDFHPGALKYFKEKKIRIGSG